MKRMRLWLVLVLALVSGAVAGYLALDLLKNRVSPVMASLPGTAEVVVAAHDMPAGTIVGPADVKMVEWPASSASEGYARSSQEVVGRGLVVPVSADEPLMKSKLADRGSGGGLPIVIPEGMRGVSVKVDEVIGVAGFVLPGTRVDVLVTMSPSSDREKAVSKVVLQNVATLAAGQMTQRDAEGTPQNVPVVTLLVTPEEAEKLTLASTEGRIQLALRSALDHETVQTPGARAASLVQGEVVAPRPAPARRVSGPARTSSSQSVVTYDGTERKVTTF